MLKFLQVALSATLFIAPLVAQTLTISGTVQDTTGIIPGAVITLRDPVGAKKEATSDESGNYKFEGLRAGAYQLVVKREGFSADSRDLTLTTESRTVDFTLSVDGVRTTVDVNDVVGRGTASGMEVSNLEIPNYTVSVTQRLMQEQGVTELSQALENVSGVSTQVQYGVYEWYTIGGVTQQSGNDFLYVDGVRLTGNRSASQINYVEEVQVFKGPNSILYGGAGAGQGGIINLIRKKPSALRAHELQYRAGRWGMQAFTGGTTGQVFNLSRLMYRVDSSFARSDGWRQTGSDRFNVAPSLTWLINSRMRVSTFQAFIHDDYTLDAGLRIELINRPGGVPFDRKMNPAGDFQKTRDWQNSIVYTWNISNNLTFTNTFFKRRNRDQYLDAESMGYNAAQDVVTRAYLYYQHNRRPVQNVSDLVGDVGFLGMRHRFLVRYDWSDQFNYTNRTGNAPGVSNAANLPLTSVPVGAFIAGTWVDPSPRYRDFPLTRRDYSSNLVKQVLFQDQINPVRWLGVNIAVSPQSYLRRTHNDVYNSGVFVSRPADTVFKNNIRPVYRFGAALLTQDTWPAWIRGFRPYFSYNTSYTPVNQQPADGSLLDPEISEGWEVGNKWQGLRNKLLISSAARKIVTQNKVISLGNGVFEQYGSSSTYNMDFDIQGYLPWGFWTQANYGYADSLIDRLRSDGLPQTNGGRRLPQAPKHTSRIWLTKAIRLNETTRLNLSVGGRYQGRYFANAANTAIVPSRTTMDGSVTLTRDRYDIGVNFANLLNVERYFVSQINGGGLLYPGQPFSATATVRFRFR